MSGYRELHTQLLLQDLLDEMEAARSNSSTVGDRITSTETDISTNAADIDTLETNLAAVEARLIAKFSDYTNIATMISTIGSTPSFILCDSAETLTANATFPTTMQVMIVKGGSITLGDYNLTINGPFKGCPGCFVLSGTGVVSFGTGPVSAVYPEWFGAAGNGTTDDSDAVSAAVASLPSGGILRFLPGRSYVFGSAHITQDIIIDLNGSIMEALVYTGDVSKNMFYSESTDAVDYIEIKNGKLDGNGTTRGSGIDDAESLIDIDGAGTVKIIDVEVYGHAAGVNDIPTEINARTLAAIRLKDCSRVIVDRLVMHDNWNEQLWICSDTETGRISVTNSQWYNGYFDAETTQRANSPITIVNVASALVENNTIIDSNCSAMNLMTANAIVRGNFIDTVNSSHGIDLTESLVYSDNSIVSNNIIKNCEGRGIQISGSNIKVTGNNIYNCYNGIYVIAAIKASSSDYGDWCITAYEDHYNVLIEGNTIHDVNYSSSTHGTGITIRHNGTDDSHVFKGVKIRDNFIYQPGANVSAELKQCIVLMSVDDVEIINNTLYDFTSYAVYSSQGPISNLSMVGNRLASNGFAVGSFIYFNFTGNALNHEYIKNIFEDMPPSGQYHIRYTTATTDEVRLINNDGLRKWNSTAANTYYRKDDFPNVTTTPSSGTYNLGDVVKKTAAAGSVEGYVMVTRNGTLGTLNSGGTTGSISSGSYSLTVNDATGLSAGMYITITGAGVASANLTTMVTEVSGTTITLWDSASTTVSDVAISYSGPDIKTVGAIGA